MAPTNFEQSFLCSEHSEQALKIKANEGNLSKIQARIGSSGCSKQDCNPDGRQSLGEEQPTP
jgi:hypothetical protein